MRFTFGNVLLLALVIAAGAFMAAPWFAFRSMRDAAHAGDAPALAQVVDYNAVKTSLADQLTGEPARTQAPAPDLLHDPIGAIKHVFSSPSQPVPPQVDAYVSPDGLAALSDGRAPGHALAANAHEPFPKVLFWGPDRCRIGVSDPGPPARTTEFTFTRKGIFTWKLTRIELPARAKANPA
jgi:hypothetical protein